MLNTSQMSLNTIFKKSIPFDIRNHEPLLEVVFFSNASRWVLDSIASTCNNIKKEGPDTQQKLI